MIKCNSPATFIFSRKTFHPREQEFTSIHQYFFHSFLSKFVGSKVNCLYTQDDNNDVNSNHQSSKLPLTVEYLSVLPSAMDVIFQLTRFLFHSIHVEWGNISTLLSVSKSKNVWNFNRVWLWRSKNVLLWIVHFQLDNLHLNNPFFFLQNCL